MLDGSEARVSVGPFTTLSLCVLVLMIFRILFSSLQGPGDSQLCYFLTRCHSQTFIICISQREVEKPVCPFPVWKRFVLVDCQEQTIPGVVVHTCNRAEGRTEASRLAQWRKKKKAHFPRKMFEPSNSQIQPFYCTQLVQTYLYYQVLSFIQ